MNVITQIGVSDQYTFSEESAFALQEAVLTPGFHTVHVNNSQALHTLYELFLPLLARHHTVGVLTLSHVQLHDAVLPLYAMMVQRGLGNENLQDILAELYIEHLVIEETPTLLALPWYQEFQEILISLHLHTIVAVRHDR